MIETLGPVADAIAARGGRAIVVGGYVRDRLLRELGRPADEAKDLDVEVFGLAEPELAAVLRGFGEVISYGRAFPVLRVVGREIDFALPRGADFASAARARDLTIHAIGLDPRTGELLDPLGGRADLERRVLRAADARTFGSDPLRGLRVMQVTARFAMTPDAELLALCAGLDLGGLPGERVRSELEKLLLRAERPSVGLEFLRETQLLRFFPELAALVGAPQDPRWHPEGDVWTHTLLAVDVAASLREGNPDDLALMYGVLCHDLGKPASSQRNDERVSAHGHEATGIAAAQRFLERLRAPHALVARVCALVQHHRAPSQLARGEATAKAYRRLVRRLREVQVTPELLERVARADHLGRTTPDALARSFPEGDRFLAALAALAIPPDGPRDAVLGRHLLARGLAPGPEFARILARCREVQDDTGWSDPEAILRRALGD